MKVWLTRILGSTFRRKPWTWEQSRDTLNLDKASGPPFNYQYGPSKGDVLMKLSDLDLVKHWFSYDQYHDATLKDELRVLGKDARLFIPANVQHCLVGNRLFGAQNDMFVRHHFKLPFKLGVHTPAYDMYSMWRNYVDHDGQKIDTDGAQFDAWFPLINACLCRDVRADALPLEEQFIEGLPYTFYDAIIRYYDATYASYVNVFGFVYQFFGQMSGQINTATDNCICNYIPMMLHAYRKEMTFDQFVETVLVFNSGDDMIASVPDADWLPVNLQRTFNSINMYIESACLTGKDPQSIMFVGCSPIVREVFGRSYRLYCYRQEKLTESLDYRKGVDENDRAAKLVSVTSLLFGDKELFEETRKRVRAWFYLHEAALSSQAIALLAQLDDLYLLRLFTGYECF